MGGGDSPVSPNWTLEPLLLPDQPEKLWMMHRKPVLGSPPFPTASSEPLPSWLCFGVMKMPLVVRMAMPPLAWVLWLVLDSVSSRDGCGHPAGGLYYHHSRDTHSQAPPVH